MGRSKGTSSFPQPHTTPSPTPSQRQRSRTLPSLGQLGLSSPRHRPAVQKLRPRPRATSRPRAEPASIVFCGNPVRRYYLDDVPYDMEVPTNEDHNLTLRRTADGRTLKYTLTVLQQPERARACGSGARSDRRPVDPPPVIELRVFEGQGETPVEWADITSKHNATFILCASLENARPIARGRLHTPTSIASLQGVNFAGTNYLERPKQAGYFIFPDLSVRNEGWYRLSFSLLEGTKEAKDADLDRQFPPSPRPQDDGKPKAPLNFEDMATRLDVRSRPFQVFSAKKFPGLSESTELSRLVADQGCRVRIRRDVRMRKHGARKDDGESYESEGRSTSRFQTPDTSAYHAQTPTERPRSNSRASMDGSQHALDPYYRPAADMAYFGQQHHPPTSMSHGSVAPSPSAVYPVQPGSMATTSSSYSYSSYPHTPTQTHSNGFALPQFRRSLDSTNVIPPPTEPRLSLPALAAIPRVMTPENPKSSPSSSLSIHSLTHQSNGYATYDSSRRQWIAPVEPGPSKRSYSPNVSHVHSLPLKAGRRPDSTPKARSSNSTGVMEADYYPYLDREDSSEEQPGTMNYKRANGSTGRKPVPHSFNRPQGES